MPIGRKNMFAELALCRLKSLCVASASLVKSSLSRLLPFAKKDLAAASQDLAVLAARV